MSGADLLLLVPMALLVLLGTTHLSVAIVNWLVTLLVTPQRLPRMDLSDGIPRRVSHFGGSTHHADQFSRR